jgi:hypothetical protein
MNMRTKHQILVWHQIGLWRENMMLTLRIIQFCHANKKAPAARPILAKFPSITCTNNP